MYKRLAGIDRRAISINIYRCRAGDRLNVGDLAKNLLAPRAIRAAGIAARSRSPHGTSQGSEILPSHQVKTIATGAVFSALA
ncbi:MAG TPA: hypothetical protein DCY88_05560 [Cyanobacteria bacterium UBA11372]|nr:hypothetical protein [Cyanobacteria bacterium UBA11372]